MEILGSTYSPHILIYIDTGVKKIRLADVLYDTGTLYERAELSPGTQASLVFSINGIEEREEITLPLGISTEDTTVNFTYSDPARLNGRSFCQS